MIGPEYLRRIFATAAVCTVWAVTAHAANLRDLAGQADAILIGTVTSRTQTAEGVSFSLGVEEVFKGELVENQAVSVVHYWANPQTPSSEEVVITNQLHGVWFVKRMPSGNWDILPGFGPDYVISGFYWRTAASLPESYHYDSTSSVLDALILEVGAGIEAGDGIPEAMLTATESIDLGVVRTVMGRFVESKRPALQAVGLAGELRLGETGALLDLMRLWPTIRTEPQSQFVVSCLRDDFRDSSPQSVERLSEISSAEAMPQELRKAAASAIAWIHSQEAAPILASMLLDPDAEKRMIGALGLSLFANGCPIQTRERMANARYLDTNRAAPFKTTETMKAFVFGPAVTEREPDLVHFWLNWWAENNGKIQKGVTQ